METMYNKVSNILRIFETIELEAETQKARWNLLLVTVRCLVFILGDVGSFGKLVMARVNRLERSGNFGS